jgi:hypothetical protein
MEYLALTADHSSKETVESTEPDTSLTRSLTRSRTVHGFTRPFAALSDSSDWPNPSDPPPPRCYDWDSWKP